MTSKKMNVIWFWVCLTCDRFFRNESEIVNLHVECGCKGQKIAFISAQSINDVLEEKGRELVMKTMYDGSMGVMFEPDLSVYKMIKELQTFIREGIDHE